MIIELNLVENNPEMFRRGFREWLMENAGIWRAFENEAERVWAKGRTHWSAHTIIRVSSRTACDRHRQIAIALLAVSGALLP